MSWRRRQRELEQELAAHLRMAAEAQRVAGAADPAAAARREFGNYDQVAEATRKQWRGRWLADAGRDVKLAARDLRHHRGYAAVAVITFGLAMAAFAAIFGMMDAIYYHPAPYVPHAGRVAWIEPAGPGRGNTSGLAPAEFRALATRIEGHGGAFRAVAATTFGSVVWNDGAPLELGAGYASPGYFRDVLEAVPRWGRGFTAGDYEPGRGSVIVSYEFWQTHLEGSGGAVGRVVHLDGQPYTVIGILGRQFDVPAGVDVWLPLRFTPLEWSTTWAQIQQRGANAGAMELGVWARLRAGASWTQANAELASVSASLPEGGAVAPRLSGKPMKQVINGNLMPLFANALLAAMGFLLLLACANVANLNLARASSRQHELTLRAALGASGARLAWMVVTEALLLAFLGGVVGLALAEPMLHLLGAGAPPGFSAEVTGYGRIGLNYHVLLAAFAICAAAGVLSGLAPAWRVVRRRDGLDALHARAHGGGEGGRGRRWLVGVQTALALILLACTGLMLTGFSHFAAGRRRVQPEGVLTFGVSLPAARYATAAARARFYQSLMERLRPLPGVEAVVGLTTVPYSNNGTTWVRYEAPAAPEIRNRAIVQNVSPGFFAALHVPLAQGRDFSANDDAGAPAVAIVSQNLARARWPGRDALGQRVRIGNDGPWLTVVGVAGGIEYDWTDEADEPAIYRPLAQTAPARALIAVRSRTAPTTLAAAIRRQAAQLDAQLPLLNLQTLEEDIAFALTPVYMLGYMMAALGLIALALTLAGLYGVTSYSAQRRLRELGVRAVCGARPRQLTRLLVGGGMRPVVAGMALGGLGAVWFGRVAAKFFFGVQPGDAWPIAGAAALLLLTALTASFLPAHRAAARDPMRVLREE